jgi:hypothetical protein
MLPALAFEHANGFAAAGIKYRTNERRRRVAVWAGTFGVAGLERLARLIDYLHACIKQHPVGAGCSILLMLEKMEPESAITLAA